MTSAKYFLFFISFQMLLATEFERRIVIVTASYKNHEWYQWNLDSVFSQQYTNYHLIYIDDCSPDGTYELVQEYIKERGYADRVTLIHNSIRQGAMANQYRAIHMCKDTDLIIILDGDDRLAHEGVLAFINRVYADSSVWLTYGQFREYPTGNRGFCCPMPNWVVENNAFRDYVHTPSHLRTFYAGLFKKINKEDLMYEDDFLKVDADIAAMFPMIEMARGGHFRFIKEVLLEYNAMNPINDHKLGTLQHDLDIVIRSRPRYEKIAGPFAEQRKYRHHPKVHVWYEKRKQIIRRK